MKNALIIEDSEDNRVLITRILENSGYRTSEAELGQQGFEMAYETLPDVILLDMQLPDMDGVKVAQMLCGANKTRDIPIIVVTSYALSGEREMLLELGCRGYIEKPFDPTIVVNEVERMIEGGA